MKYLVLLILSITCLFSSCIKKNAEDAFPDVPDCELSGITYTLTIKPVISNHCLSCHTGTALTGYDFSTYEGLKVVADNGKLINSINHVAGAPPMPQGAAKLDDCTIEQITKWVSDGALNN